MNLIADLSFAVRRLRRAPGFFFATVLMLALGIGISVSMFSLLRGVLLAGLPYPGGDRVVSVNSANARLQAAHGPLTPAEAVEIADAGARSPFRHFGYYNWGGITLFDGKRPRETTITVVSDGFFPALGMQPVLGRWFTPEEHAAQQGNVVLSYTEWQRLLGGRASAIGEFVDTSEGRLRVVGVMPAEFSYPSPSVGAWMPRGHFNTASPSYQHARFINGVGRLEDSLSAGLVNERLAAIASSVRTRNSLPDEGWQFTDSSLLDDLVGDLRGTLWSAFAIAVLVLLIACTNVAILFDARQAARGTEQTVARALGASTGQIRRALLLELGVLAGLGVGFGVFASWSALGALRELARNSVPRVDAIVLDPVVLAFAVGLGLAAPFLVAAAGALRQRSMMAGDGAAVVRGHGNRLLGGDSGLRRLLPALAVAFSTVSLIAATAFGLSLMRLKDVAPGFHAQGVHAMQLFRQGDRAAWPGFAEQMQERLAALPGVRAVALTSAAPLSVNGALSVDLQIPGRAQAEPFQAGLRRVSASYLQLMSIPLLAGRDLAKRDRDGTELVALINRTLAKRTFGESSPIGQILGLPLGQGPRINYRIVGVTEDIRNDGLRSPAAPEILIPFAQAPWASMTFLVRSADGASSTASAAVDAQMAQQVWAIDPRQAITRQFGLDGELDSELETVRFFSRTVGGFALLALILAAVGVYAVAALQQRRRVREFGLRLAVGARPALLGWQILREGLRVVGVGAALGLAGAWAALRLIAAQIFGVQTLLPWVMAAGVLAISVTALAALMLPALRAVRTDPMTALRYE